MKVRFGPAGIPIQCEGKSTLEGVRCCSRLGLTAMEMEFVQGVRLKEPAAREIGKAAKELGIMLSSHAPYFINFCSDEKQKIANSVRNLLESARITAAAGGRITVFHPGFYQTRSPEEAYANAKKNIMEAAEKLGGGKVVLGAETVGKKGSFGGLDEVIRLSQDIPAVQPVLDFAHLHARGDFRLENEDDYRKLFSHIEKELPGYMNHFHAHFSEINYTDKGERNHLPLGTNNEPPFRPLMKVLSQSGYCGVIICETPKIDLDAQKMQKFYARLVKE
ncbi:MAG: TIM barrel protein [Candidatus Micrarchaeota archaeon]